MCLPRGCNLLQHLRFVNYDILYVDYDKLLEPALKILEGLFYSLVFNKDDMINPPFLLKTSRGITILFAYVDDIIITGDDLGKYYNCRNL